MDLLNNIFYGSLQSKKRYPSIDFTVPLACCSDTFFNLLVFITTVLENFLVASNTA